METKNILTVEVLAVLRAMVSGDATAESAALAERLTPLVAGILNQIRPLNPLSAAEVYPHVLSAINGFRVTPEGVVSSDANFDPTWLDRVDKTGWKRWENLKKYLLEFVSPVRTPADINSLDLCSDDVIRWAGPAELQAKRKGLVLG